MVYCETLPLPETRQILPFSVSSSSSAFLRRSRRSVAGGFGTNQGASQARPLPVRTPVNSLRRRLYWPNMKPISRPPTPMSPAERRCRADVALQFGHEALTEAHDFGVALAFGIESEPPLPRPWGAW